MGLATDIHVYAGHVIETRKGQNVFLWFVRRVGGDPWTDVAAGVAESFQEAVLDAKAAVDRRNKETANDS